jgi:hypothetical protein
VSDISATANKNHRIVATEQAEPAPIDEEGERKGIEQPRNKATKKGTDEQK